MKIKTKKVYYLGKLSEDGTIELLGLLQVPHTFASYKEADSVLTFIMNMSPEFYEFRVYSGSLKEIV